VRKNKGFTLIELMIVVAIIAILAAIAIPNFLSFVTKTKRSEVKYNLSGIYTAEVSYFGEANSFSNSFQVIRWVPEGTIYYYTFSVGTELFGKGEANPGVPAAADSLSFTAYGWGSIDADAVPDVWYTNDRKEMVNETDDLNS
jgi:prepilin-type N-terminal cleavage/methylation domain-containing protein